MIDIIKIGIICVTLIVGATWIGSACASLVGQSEPDDQGYIMCYYEDFNTGETWMRRSLYACSSQ